MTQTERDAVRAAAARARREAAKVLREKALAAKMAARAEALAAKAEARLAAQEDLFEARREAKVARGVARAMRESDRRTNQQVLGAVLLAIGGNWLLAEFGLFTFGWPGLFAVALMTLGMAMVFTATAGRTKPLIVLGIVLTIGLAMSSGISNPVRGQNFGDQLYVPGSEAQVRENYELTAGEMTIDLSRVEFSEGLREVDARVGAGELRVFVPEGVAVDIAAEVGAGDITIFDTVSEDGFGADETYTDDGFRTAPVRLGLDLEVSGPGEIVVERR